MTIEDLKIFDYIRGSTQRRIKTIYSNSTANTIFVETFSPMYTVSAGDTILVQNCGTNFSGTFPVIDRTGSVMKLRKNSVTLNKIFTPVHTKTSSTSSKVFKKVSGADVEERRRLRLFNYDYNLTAGGGMCATQRRVKKILEDVYGDPEWVIEYKTMYNSTAWAGFGDGAAAQSYNLNDIVSGFMCTIYQESTWIASNVGTSGDKTYRGLWQIDEKTEAPWWPTDTSLLLDPEYNTRAAIWIMFDRLFTYPDGAQANPFNPFYGSRYTAKNDDGTYKCVKYRSCWDNYKLKKVPPYGTSNC